MSLTIRPRSMTREEYASTGRVVTTTARRPPEEGSVTISEIERPDHTRVFVEGRRGAGGVMRYFLRDETLRAAAEAAGSDTGELDLGGATVTMISYGHVDGDGHNDMILRTADTPNDEDTEDQLYVITTSGEVGELTVVPEAAAPEEPAYDPEPITGEPTAGTSNAEGGQIPGSSSPPPPVREDFHVEYRANISPSAREGI